jgi:hypothetical protein
MKRALLQNVNVAPYESGDVIDRQNFLSMVLAAATIVADTLTLTIAHCDTSDGTFETVTDTRVFPLENNTFQVVSGNKVIVPGVYDIQTMANAVLNVDIDLVGCKQFITITASGNAATDAVFAYVLGDPQYAPA